MQYNRIQARNGEALERNQLRYDPDQNRDEEDAIDTGENGFVLQWRKKPVRHNDQIAIP
uniref:Uncharacterized protein n=1 Tax=Setaria digitata TaxID=48799 RepID=A0A915PVC9_9BILA